MPDEVDARLGEIETALAAFADRPEIYDPAEIVRAGAFVSIDSEGGLSVDRGYVRPEDEAPASTKRMPKPTATAMPDKVVIRPRPRPARRHHGRRPAPRRGRRGRSVRPLPDRLVSELTAYRTLALRDAVANNPQVAMTALLHKLCLDTFQHAASGACLEAAVRQVFSRSSRRT